MHDIHEFSYNKVADSKQLNEFLDALNKPATVLYGTLPSDMHCYLNFDYNKTRDVVVVVTVDHDMDDMLYDHLCVVSKQYPDKLFFFASPDGVLKQDTINIITLISSYNKSIEVDSTRVIEKNFDSEQTILNLNRQNRPHRLVLASYLAGDNVLGLKSKVTFLHMHKQVDKTGPNFFNAVDWDFPTPEYTEQFQRGYDKLVMLPPGEIYEMDNESIVEIDNKSNMDKLETFYQNSFVEIISNTYFSNPMWVALNEKVFNSIIGMNFFILISPHKTIERSRAFVPGLDFFDDIIDHSYDDIEDTWERLHQAIELNRAFLEDTKLQKETWIKNKHRLEQNREYLKSSLIQDIDNYTVQYNINKIPPELFNIK